MSFIDYTLLDEYFKPDSHRRGQNGYSKKQLFNTLISMQIEQFSDIKSLVVRLKSDSVSDVASETGQGSGIENHK